VIEYPLIQPTTELKISMLRASEKIELKRTTKCSAI
jgi:hypothetical protein